MGRPSSFRPEYVEQTVRLCRLGAIDADLADFFGVSETTINNWKNSQPTFLEALKSGKEVADAEVADRLFQRATGYEHDEVKVFLHEGEPVIVPLTKRYPPDTTAAIFWLKNRRPDLWRDRHEHEHSGKVTLAEVVAQLPANEVERLSALPDDELRAEVERLAGND